MEDADCGLQQTKQVNAAERPAVPQKDVVLFLDADAGELAQDVEPVGQVLELHEVDIPIALLLLRDGLQGKCGVAVAPTAVMEENVDLLHEAHSAISAASLREHTRCHVDNRESPLCSISSVSTFTQNSLPLHRLFISSIPELPHALRPARSLLGFRNVHGARLESLLPRVLQRDR